MLRSDAENHKRATGVKILRTVSCAALPVYWSDPLNTFPVNFILHISRARVLHVPYVLPTCCTMFILLLIIAPTCLGNSHIFQDLFHLKKTLKQMTGHRKIYQCLIKIICCNTNHKLITRFVITVVFNKLIE